MMIEDKDKEREARKWEEAIQAAEQEAKRRDEQFRIHQEEMSKWLGEDDDTD